MRQTHFSWLSFLNWTPVIFNNVPVNFQGLCHWNFGWNHFKMNFVTLLIFSAVLHWAVRRLFILSIGIFRPNHRTIKHLHSQHLTNNICGQFKSISNFPLKHLLPFLLDQNLSIGCLEAQHLVSYTWDNFENFKSSTVQSRRWRTSGARQQIDPRSLFQQNTSFVI